MSTGILITPEQFTPQELAIGKNYFTGMVECPQRLSHIAVLRCAEYQREYGCGLGCKNAVTREQIIAVIAQSKRDVETDEPIARARGYRVCTACGKKKRSSKGTRCAACRAAATRKTKIVRCGECGRPATRYLKTDEPLCGNCANNRLNGWSQHG